MNTWIEALVNRPIPKKEEDLVMLVMKRPHSCSECRLKDISSMRGDKLCLAAGGRWIETQNEGVIPEWCPLQKVKGVIC